jgi:hypothetical protein
MDKPERPAQPGLHLVVNVMHDDVVILRSAPLRNAGRRALQPPFLDPARKYRFDRTAAELVLDVLDVKARVIESFSWLWNAEAFHDRPHEDVYDGIQGGRVYSALGLRILVIPVDAAAALLRFSRSDVSAGPEERGVVRTPLSLYEVRPLGTHIPPPPFPGPPLTPRALPGATRMADVG